MSVADDAALASQSLRSGVVGLLGVGESSKLHVLDGQLDGDVLAGLDHVIVLGIPDDSGHHPCRRWNISHGLMAVSMEISFQNQAVLTNTVAGATGVLQAV